MTYLTSREAGKLAEDIQIALNKHARILLGKNTLACLQYGEAIGLIEIIKFTFPYAIFDNIYFNTSETSPRASGCNPAYPSNAKTRPMPSNTRKRLNHNVNTFFG